MTSVTRSAAFEQEGLLAAELGAIDEPGRRASLHLRGALCAITAPEHQRQLDELIERGLVSLRLELGGLRLCTSHGLDLWDEVQHRLDGVDGRLTLAGATGVVRRVLEIAADPAVHFCPTVEPHPRPDSKPQPELGCPG